MSVCLLRWSQHYKFLTTEATKLLETANPPPSNIEKLNTKLHLLKYVYAFFLEFFLRWFEGGREQAIAHSHVGFKENL